MAWRDEPGDCPRCAAPSTVSIFTEANGHEHRYPSACCDCSNRIQRAKADVVALLDRFPDLNPRTRNCLVRGSVDIMHAGGLRAATDDDLLKLRNFGGGSLAEVRQYIPPPAPRSPVVQRDDWCAYAEMVALGGLTDVQS